ncbi:MAG: hypothetical protein FWE67_14935, partial [Planctomycetaceae bacterium]|nr:hypothetical protein [Planctomycetaceae bacterium]
MKKTITNYAVPFLLLALLLSGCGAPTVPVSGKIVFDGVPAENIAVLFQPQVGGEAGKNAPVAAYGKTDKNGAYSLKLLHTKQAGVIPGEYAVFLSWKDTSGEVVNITETDTQLKNKCPYKIPPRATSGEMIFTVPAGGTSKADFELDSSKESMQP